MSLYDAVRDLPLRIEGYDLEGLELLVRPQFTRQTTVIHLRGGGEEGLGEDVTYEGAEHDRQRTRGTVLPLQGDWTLDTFSRHLASLPLFDHEPEQPRYADYRRWAFESAALDLALRQAGRLARRSRRPRSPPGRSSSPPADSATRRARSASARSSPPIPAFASSSMPGRTGATRSSPSCASSSCVDSIDLKGQYRGTVVDNPPDPNLYRRVIEAFPDAWLEDPALTPETEPVLEPQADRVTWDAIIHSVEDIRALRWPPRTVNVKPSRFGTIERLFATYEYCEENGIGAYGGGQWELSIGRGADPAAGGPVPSGHAERRRSGRIQRRDASRRPSREPARRATARDGLRRPVVAPAAAPTRSTTPRGTPGALMSRYREICRASVPTSCRVRAGFVRTIAERPATRRDRRPRGGATAVGGAPRSASATRRARRPSSRASSAARRPG